MSELEAIMPSELTGTQAQMRYFRILQSKQSRQNILDFFLFFNHLA